jgi:hypothetical protein
MIRRRISRIAPAAMTLLLGCAALGIPGTARTAPDGGAAAAAAEAPRVEPAYQKSIDRAWAKAVAGEPPGAACAGVKGRAVGTKNVAGAQAALDACNVDIPARYFETFLDRVDSGEKTCSDLMMQVLTQLPAMTMSTETFERMVEQGEGVAQDSTEAETQATSAGAAVLAAAAEDAVGESDPRKRVKQRIEGRVRKACPDIADTILR